MRFSDFALLLAATANAWTTLDFGRVRKHHEATKATTRLFNVPPPSREDVVAYKAYASKQAPPASFFELQQDCIRSAKMAIEDGIDLLEVEFPPLPANVLEMDDVSAYAVMQANLNLAMDFAKGFSVAGNNVAILLPDESEAKIAVEQVPFRR